MKKLILILLVISYSLPGQGFLKVNGKKIYDGTNEEVLLKGIGLGGWLLQEGYMLQTSGFANSEHEIRNKIVELIGETKTEEFYSKYWKNYVREIDIKNIAEWGFNSIRLPMHYSKLTALNLNEEYYESGFAQIDSLLSWCEKYNLYLILDLHAAPGGQSDEPISDYDNTKLSLWESETNKTITVNLWKEIARRYKDKTSIGGYDLLNEPKWFLGDKNEQLKDMYVRITKAIREVDTNHILFVEGNWFATDFNGLTPPWDDKLVYSFHKYWNSNDRGAINYLLDLRNNTNKPLWLGETGENSNSWFLDCVELMKENNIGWSWWPHKKIESISGPLSVYKLPQYQQLIDYWNGNGSKPSETFTYTTLLAQADNLKFEKCKFQPDVIDAIFRQVNDKSLIPFSDNKIPGKIYAVNYDLGARGYAYYDNDYEKIGNTNWNTGWSYRNDGVDIEECSDITSIGYNVGWIESGEWLKYTLNVEQSGLFDIALRYSANNSDGKILFVLDGKNISSFIDLSSTGGWQNWQSLIINDININAGLHELQVKFFFGGFNINYFEFIQTAVGIEDESKIENEFKLNQNYPNPFNPSTTIEYTIPEKSFVELNLFDILGNKIFDIVNELQDKGVHKITFNSSNLTSGVYFYTIKTGSFIDSKKMLVLK